MTLIFDKDDRRTLTSNDDAGGAFASNSKSMKKKGKNMASSANSDAASATIEKPVRNPNYKDLTFHYRSKKGHISSNCYKKKRDLQNKVGLLLSNVATKGKLNLKLFSNLRFANMLHILWSG